MKRRNFFAVLAGLPLVRLVKFKDLKETKVPANVVPGQLAPFNRDTHDIWTADMPERDVVVCTSTEGKEKFIEYLKKHRTMIVDSYEVRNIGTGSDRIHLLKR